MALSNLHTHTLFCDGKDEPEALVLEAIRLGCPTIGFSGHAHTAFDESWCMSAAGTEAYRSAVLSLKEKYRSQIRILLGVEQDIYSDASTAGYDYVIGSVHYVRKNGDYLPVDESRDEQLRVVRTYYGGDFYAFAEDYYDTVAQVYSVTKCDIVGHFDLITKFNEGGTLFDPAHPRYIAAAERALDALIPTPAAFEVNTGAIARGYRCSPYPALAILHRLQNAGKRLILTSDCHRRDQLLFGFENAEALICPCKDSSKTP